MHICLTLGFSDSLYAGNAATVSEFPTIRVIGLSMHEEADMAAAMRKAGAAAYLAKGGPTEALIAAIRAR